MDRDLIETKLDMLRHCVRRLESKCPQTSEQLSRDQDLQDIIAMNLARAVQLSVDIAAHILAQRGSPPPNTMAESFAILRNESVLDEETATRMQKAVGFRNIAVHAYEKIDWRIVHSICQDRLGDFTRFAQAISIAILSPP